MREWQDGYDAGYEQGFWVGACAGVPGVMLIGTLVFVMVLG